MAFCRACGHDIQMAAFCTKCGTASARPAAQTMGASAGAATPPTAAAATPAPVQLSALAKPPAEIPAFGISLLLSLLLLNALLAACTILPLFSDGPDTSFRRLQFWSAVATGAVWLWWLRAAYRRLREMTPAEAHFKGVLLVWFLPPFNLYKPYQVMRDLGAKTSFWLIVVWWASCLAWLFFKIYNYSLIGDRVFANFRADMAIDLAIDTTGFIAAATAYALVREVAGRTRWPKLGLPLIGITAGGLFVLTVWGFGLFLAPNPEDSLQALGEAITHSDLDEFRAYFNTRSVIENGVQQLLVKPEVVAWEAQKTGIPPVVLGYLNGFIRRFLVKHYIPGLAYRLESGVVLGEYDVAVPEEYQDVLTDTLTVKVPEKYLKKPLVGSFQKATILNKFASSALVRFDFTPALPAPKPISVTALMVQVRSHWQIVAIQDVDGLIQSVPVEQKQQTTARAH